MWNDGLSIFCGRLSYIIYGGISTKRYSHPDHPLGSQSKYSQSSLLATDRYPRLGLVAVLGGTNGCNQDEWQSKQSTRMLLKYRMWSGVLVVQATEWRSGRQSEGEKTKRQGHHLVRILAWDAGDGELGCTHFLWRGWLLQGGCVFYFVWWASRKTMRRRRGFGSLLGPWFGRHLRQFLWRGWLLWGGGCILFNWWPSSLWIGRRQGE